MKVCEYHLCEYEASYGTSKRFCSAKCKSKYGVRKTRYNNKIKAVKYLGGKCVKCGYNKHPAALQFHHNQGEKNFGLSNGTGWARAWKTLLKELDLCELICANCHAIEHYKNENYIAV